MTHCGADPANREQCHVFAFPSGLRLRVTPNRIFLRHATATTTVLSSAYAVAASLNLADVPGTVGAGYRLPVCWNKICERLTDNKSMTERRPAPPDLPLPRRRLRLQDRARRARARSCECDAGVRAARSCWSASRPPTMPRSIGSTTSRRWSRRPTSSCRSSTIRSTSARIAATNAISDVYAMGGTPIMALALVGMPIDQLRSRSIRRDPRRRRIGLRAAGIPIAGGHTIDSVEPIYGLVAMGLVIRRR